MHARAESPGGEAEQPAAGSYVEEAASTEVVRLQHESQRAFGFSDALIIQRAKEPIPVRAERESLAASKLHRMGFW